MLGGQKGVTLLEVLVGFVIFTSALVAVLEYVSSQIYHGHLSTSSLDKVQMIYDLSTLSELGDIYHTEQNSQYDDFSWSLTSSNMGAFTSNPNEPDILLKSHTYSVMDKNNTFNWTVLKFN